MLLFNLESRPSSLANSLFLLFVLRSFFSFVLLMALLFAPVFVALLFLFLYLVFNLLCFLSVRRFVLAVFSLAQKSVNLEK